MALFVILLRILKLTPFEFEVVMSQQPVEKKSVPWLLMGLGLLIPFLLLEYFSWLQKVMLRLKKQYEQQRLEMEKRIAEKEAASSEKK